MTTCAFCGDPAECLVTVVPDPSTWGADAWPLTVRACLECADHAGPILHPLGLSVSVGVAWL